MPNSKTQYVPNTNEGNLFHVDYLKNTFADFARPNLYKIELNVQHINSSEFFNDAAKIKTEQCIKSVNIPNFEFTKKEIKRMGYKISIPAIQNFPDIQCTFISDDTYTSRKFLHNWWNFSIYDLKNNSYSSNIQILNSNIIIHQLDNNYNKIFSVKLHNAWPNSVGEVQLSYDSDSQIVEFPVTFTYSTYEILEIN